MSTVRQFFQNLLYAIPNIGITDILDILVVAFLIYHVLLLIHSTAAARIGKAILMLLVITWVTEMFDMYALNWILSKILELGVIALVIMFQPELRRGLERVGGQAFRRFTDPNLQRSEMQMAISATVSACEKMAREKVGVLLVFERTTSLQEYFKTGTVIDAQVTEELLRNLFFPKASLHDGAVIIRNGRIAAAGCVMPLSDNSHLSSDLGTRHRAGVGTSENSDAVVVIVSEETGTISVAVGGMLKRHLAPQTLEKILTAELIPSEEAERRGLRQQTAALIKRFKKHEEK